MLSSSEKALLLRDMLTMMVRTGIMSCAQSLSSHAGMGSRSHDLTGDDFDSVPISVSVAGSNAFSKHVWYSPSVQMCTLVTLGVNSHRIFEMFLEKQYENCSASALNESHVGSGVSWSVCRSLVTILNSFFWSPDASAISLTWYSHFARCADAEGSKPACLGGCYIKHESGN